MTTTGAGGRDRDAAGRPRNARPRDGLGRPLPRGRAGAQRVPAGVTLPPEDSLREAQRLLDDGRAFDAHEVLESRWKSAPEPERELWRGLAQLAVGLTHAQRENPFGATQLLRRGANRIEGFAIDPPYGIDAAGLVVAARALAERIDRLGVGGLTRDDLAPLLKS